MAAQNQTTISLVCVGGSAPYVFQVVNGAQTTITATIAGGALTVDASSLEPGFYSVEIQITDQLGHTSTQVIQVQVLAATTFAVLTEDVAFEPSTFPQSLSVLLTSVAGSGTVSWSLIAGSTTLPGASISGSTLTFPAATFGQWTVGLRATDSLGNTATRLIEVSVVTAAVTNLVDGQVELDVTPAETATGTQSFTLQVIDSSGSGQKQQTFTFNVGLPISEIEVPEAAIDHVWGVGDTTSVVYPIEGDLNGFSLGATNSITAENGLQVRIDATNNALVVSGPPVNYQTAEVAASLVLLRNNTQVAIVTREFTLEAHNGTTDIGSMTCNPRPYISGEFVGLNPLRPYFNSPTYVKNQGYTVQLATGQSLPPGLSLDSISGQIYGNVVAGGVASTAIQYLDSTGTVHGTVTIQWDICVSQFTLLDSLTTGQIQAPYSANLGSNSSAKLTSVALHRGSFPQGLSASIDSTGTYVVVAGTPIEAGYFDCWFQVTNQNGQVAYYYKRFVVDYIPPLVILTGSLATISTNQAYSQILQGFGGVQPYTWAIAAGMLPTGITLNVNSGVLSGTTTVTSYSQPITFKVQDARGVSSTAVLTLAINNALTITSPVLPLVTPGLQYSFQLRATGGTGAYTWTLATGSSALPGGFTLSTGGLLSGATSLTNYNQNVIVQVTDAAANTVTHSYNLLIGAESGLLIDTEGIGPIVRGQNYLGLLSVTGPGVAPYAWSVSPGSPNALPAGLTLATDAANQGATATLSGITTASLLNYSVQIQVVDANGNYASTFLFLNTYSTLAITTTTLPQGTVSGVYSSQLSASGVNTPFSWSLVSGSLPPGQILSSSGLISGAPTQAGTFSFTVQVRDSIGDTAQQPLSEVTKQSTLAITTTTLPQVTAGVAYAAGLVATGGAPGYRWSISPSSPSGLPTGLSLTAAGVISGTTIQVGFNQNLVFRVTDTLDVYREITLDMSVVTSLRLKAGPDSLMGTSNGYLGMVGTGNVASINPRNNRSFLVAATGIVSTAFNQMSVGVPANFTASIIELANGEAFFQIDGPFQTLPAGDHAFDVIVVDSGIPASATFQWRVFNEGDVFFTPQTGSLPILYLN